MSIYIHMSQLLSSFGRSGINLGLATMKVDIEDVAYSSKYFVISEYNPVLTAGRNPVAFNGSIYLSNGSEVQVECLDSHGNSLYIEQAKSTNSQFTDVSKFVISIHVYAETYNGPGKLILVGTTTKGEIVRWVGNITIDKTLTNAAKVRFYNSPTLEARSLLYPVVDLSKASVDIPPVTSIGATATAHTTNIVYQIEIDTGGAGVGYTNVPIINLIGGGGSGATAVATVSEGKITGITIPPGGGGSGYITAPIVNIIADPSDTITTPAVATAKITGTVTSVTVDAGGYGYITVPSVKIGATATATATILNGAVTSIDVTYGGYGYSSVPTVEIAYPDASAPILNISYLFTSSFYSYAVSPPTNTNTLKVDKRREDIDYRLVITDHPISDLAPSMSPTRSFNSQMEGISLLLNVDTVKLPSTQKEAVSVDNNVINNTFTVKKVIDSQTVSLDKPFYYQVGKDQLITDIVEGSCTGSYNFIQYNTNAESNLDSIKQSYAEITYRNLKTYSGFVARHKLYRRSLFHPGDFELISDDPLGAIELLTDIITFNKAYTRLGLFYNDFHIAKYWNVNDTNISLTAKTSPINSVYISATNPSYMDGTKYVIVKVDSIGVLQDFKYYPYDEDEFNNLTGQSYNSNFVSLKKDSLYILSTNIIMEKDFSDTSAKVSFYFTSSIPEIKLEKNYNSTYGLTLGEVTTTDQTKIKYFSDKQVFYFTPTEDYYGTLVIVPYHCNVTLSDVSLKVYGDYGFSPDILFIRVSFPVNVSNEAFELKSELFDINSNLIYSELKTNKSFDALGNSLGATNTIVDESTVIPSPTARTRRSTTVTSYLTAADNFYLPNLELNPGSPSRLVGWIFPDGSTDSSKLCYTNISNLIIDSNDYISLSIVDINGVESTAKSIAVRYESGLPGGIRIYVDTSGVKHVDR